MGFHACPSRALKGDSVAISRDDRTPMRRNRTPATLAPPRADNDSSALARWLRRRPRPLWAATLRSRVLSAPVHPMVGFGDSNRRGNPLPARVLGYPFIRITSLDRSAQL